MPKHSHDIVTGAGNSKLNRRWQADITNVSGNTTDDLENAIYRSAGTFEVGANLSHNNLQPFLAIFCWERTS